MTAHTEASGPASSGAAPVPSQAITGDEHLLDLERRRLEAKAQRKKLNDGADLPEDDPEDNRLYDLCFDLEKEIAVAPANTATGVAIKIRLLQESHEKDWDAYYADGFRTALEALERLGGAAAYAYAARPATPGIAPVQAPEPIRALFDQSVILNDEANAVSLEAEAASDPATSKALGEKSDRIGNQALVCESAIFRVPAMTIDELILKARRAYWWCAEGENDVAQAPDPRKVAPLDDQSLIWSILQDIERMAVPAAVAASAVPASTATAVAEDPIVGLWRQVLAHRAEASRLSGLANEARERGDRVECDRQEKLVAEVDDKWQSIEAEILQMDALTAEGWAIQAEIMHECLDGAGSRNDRGDLRVAKRIVGYFKDMADAERLGGAT